MKPTKSRLFVTMTIIFALVGFVWLTVTGEPNQQPLDNELTATKITQQQTTQRVSDLNQAAAQRTSLPPINEHQPITNNNQDDPIQDLDIHETQWQPERQAIESFSQSLTIDDPRAPPINRREPPPPVDQEILDDPQLYAEHEAAQHRQMLNRYLQQAQNKQLQLTSLIAKGQRMGIDERKLEEGLQKLAALKHGIEVAKKALQN